MNYLLHPVPLVLPLILLGLWCLGVREYLRICEANRKLRGEIEEAFDRENLRNYEPMSRSATVMPPAQAEEVCEGGCSAPVVGYDSEGVPLCRECLDDLKRDSSNTTMSHAGTSARKQDGAANGVGSGNS